jgi:hypothetical protein
MNFMHKSEEVRDKWLFVAFGGVFWQELKPPTEIQVINEGHKAPKWGQPGQHTWSGWQQYRLHAVDYCYKDCTQA